jgi:lipopolysaccharide biosynthesis protein
MIIAICFHLGYIHRFNEFTPFIDNIIQYCPNTDIYITYREDTDPSDICRKKYPNVHMLKAIRGADTGAFLLQIKQLLISDKTYDYVLKLQTKSNNTECPKWMSELTEEIAGSVHKISRIFKMFYDYEDIGMISCRKWLVKRNMSTDSNYNIMKDICKRIKISPDCSFFVGGTIFWIRMDVLRRTFQGINLDDEYHKCEIGKPHEPSYTHSWERIFGQMVNHHGYKIIGI